LSFLREPDLGFAWAAYRWARGVKLEKVLAEAPDLTPGDFVRSVKQLIDLLDQIANAAPDGAAGADADAGPGAATGPEADAGPGAATGPEADAGPGAATGPDSPSGPEG